MYTIVNKSHIAKRPRELLLAPADSTVQNIYKTVDVACSFKTARSTRNQKTEHH